MNIASCDSCGVLLDKDKLKFPEEIHKEDGDVDRSKGAWSREKEGFVPFVNCPVCGAEVLK